MNIGHDDERVAFEVTAANAHHSYQYTRAHIYIYTYTYKTNIPEIFSNFFRKKKEENNH